MFAFDFTFLPSYAVCSLDVFAMLPADCFVEGSWSHYDSLLWETIIPIVVFVGIWFSECCRRMGGNYSNPLPRHLGYFLLLIMLALPSITRRIFLTLRCETFDDDSFELLAVDVGIDCESEYRPRYTLYAVVCVLIYPCGVPLLYLLWLTYYRGRLDNAEHEEAEMLDIRANDDRLLANPITASALQYRPQRWWYELVIMCRRLLLTGFVLWFETPYSMVICSQFLSVLFLVIEREASPYLQPSLSMYIYALQWQLVIFIQAFMFMDANMTTPAGTQVIGFGLLLVNAVLILVITAGAFQLPRGAEKNMAMDGVQASQQPAEAPETPRPHALCRNESKLGNVSFAEDEGIELSEAQENPGEENPSERSSESSADSKSVEQANASERRSSAGQMTFSHANPMMSINANGDRSAIAPPAKPAPTSADSNGERSAKASPATSVPSSEREKSSRRPSISVDINGIYHMVIQETEKPPSPRRMSIDANGIMHAIAPPTTPPPARRVAASGETSAMAPPTIPVLSSEPEKNAPKVRRLSLVEVVQHSTRQEYDKI